MTSVSHIVLSLCLLYSVDVACGRRMLSSSKTICNVTEYLDHKTKYGVRFQYPITGPCGKVSCNNNKLFGNDILGEILSAYPDEKDPNRPDPNGRIPNRKHCGCWARQVDSQDKVFLLAFLRTARQLCDVKTCWSKYADARFRGEAAKSSSSMSITESMVSFNHWTADCAQTGDDQEAAVSIQSLADVVTDMAKGGHFHAAKEIMKTAFIGDMAAAEEQAAVDEDFKSEPTTVPVERKRKSAKSDVQEELIEDFFDEEEDIIEKIEDDVIENDEEDEVSPTAKKIIEQCKQPGGLLLALCACRLGSNKDLEQASKHCKEATKQVIKMTIAAGTYGCKSMGKHCVPMPASFLPEGWEDE